MKKIFRSRAFLILANAMVWAACILGISKVMGEHDQRSTITGLLIAGWFAMNMMLQKINPTACKQSEVGING